MYKTTTCKLMTDNRSNIVKHTVANTMIHNSTDFHEQKAVVLLCFTSFVSNKA